MSRFSVTEAALEGFRITRERPAAVLWWWGAALVALLLQYVLGQLPLFHGMDAELTALQNQSLGAAAAPDAAAAKAQFTGVARLAPRLLAFSAVILVIQIIRTTAVLRAVLRPADQAFGYLRLSMDEVRQLGLTLLIFVCVLAYAFLVSLVASLVLSIVIRLAGGGGGGGAVGGALAFLIVALAFVYPTVRLSLAPPMTFADARLSVRRAWALSAGLFWPMLGAYAIATLLALAVAVLGATISMVASTLTSGQAGTTFLVVVVLNSLISALFGVIVTAPAASIFRQLTGRVGAPIEAAPEPGSPWG